MVGGRPSAARPPLWKPLWGMGRRRKSPNHMQICIKYVLVCISGLCSSIPFLEGWHARKHQNTKTLQHYNTDMNEPVFSSSDWCECECVFCSAFPSLVSTMYPSKYPYAQNIKTLMFSGPGGSCQDVPTCAWCKCTMHMHGARHCADA